MLTVQVERKRYETGRGERKRKMTSRLKRRIGRKQEKKKGQASRTGRWDRDSCQTGESGKGRTDETEGS
jgi:hypothetical protein